MLEATPEFKQQLRIAFDSIDEGQIFTFQRTFTEGDVALFCGVTGDYNPVSLAAMNRLPRVWLKTQVKMMAMSIVEQRKMGKLVRKVAKLVPGPPL
jgi:hypothetical protein